MWSFKSNRRFMLSENEMEDDSKTGFLPQNNTATKSNTLIRLHTGLVILQAVIAMLWLSTFWTFAPLCHQAPEVLRSLELPAVAEAIEYETVVFKVSGGGTREQPITPYEGPPTPEKDMHWYELIDVGMISLTHEMDKTLKRPTQPIGDGDETPLIQLDVFHQLHCLNAIRKIVYGTNKWYNPNDRQDQIHIDHCLDYLRQVLMCHSDVTPITHKKRNPGYNPILPDWVPNFSTPHTCRNFWKIHDWARRYNTSGYVIEAWPGIDPAAGLRGKLRDH